MLLWPEAIILLPLSPRDTYFMQTTYANKPETNPHHTGRASRHTRSRRGGGRRCAGARGAARARLAQRAAAVLLLHGTVRLQQRAEVDRGAVRAVGVRAVLAISQLELQPEQPG